MRSVSQIGFYRITTQDRINAAQLIRSRCCIVGAGNLTWRSATAFDSVLMLLKALERHSEDERLIVEMRQFFKVRGRGVNGVTGEIKFDHNGDRISPPTEIVQVVQDQIFQIWKWKHLKSMT